MKSYLHCFLDVVVAKTDWWTTHTRKLIYIRRYECTLESNELTDGCNTLTIIFFESPFCIKDGVPVRRKGLGMHRYVRFEGWPSEFTPFSLRSNLCTFFAQVFRHSFRRASSYRCLMPLRILSRKIRERVSGAWMISAWCISPSLLILAGKCWGRAKWIFQIIISVQALISVSNLFWSTRGRFLLGI